MPGAHWTLSLVDGSVICTPRQAGGNCRLHASYELERGRFSDLVLATSKVAERVDHTRIRGGQIVVQDRGLARVHNFRAVLEANANFVTRIGWRSVRLLDGNGRLVDVLQKLPAGDKPREHRVWIAGIDTPVRLIIQRLADQRAARQERKRARKSRKQGHQIDPRTSKAAGYLMLLTPYPPGCGRHLRCWHSMLTDGRGTRLQAPENVTVCSKSL